MNRINKLLDKLKSDINDTKDIDNDWFVEQALTTLDELKKQLTLTDVVKSVYVVTETDNYGRQLFREVFLDKEQAKEFLAIDNLKEGNINEINEIEFY
tara:strand:+ start:2260 stop:2553 length:294 start_codon:yes stop_codon:yes gene_type:complete